MLKLEEVKHLNSLRFFNTKIGRTIKEYGYKIWFCTLLLVVICSGCLYLDAALLVEDYHQKVIPGTTLNGIDLSDLTEAEVTSIVYGKVNAIHDRNIKIEIEDQLFWTRLHRFEPHLNYTVEELVSEIMNSQKSKPVYHQAQVIRQKQGEAFELTYHYNSLLVYEYAKDIAMKSSEQAVDPTLEITSDEAVLYEAGEQAKMINETTLHELIAAALNDHATDEIYLTIKKQSIPHEGDKQALEHVTSKVASYTSHYDPHLKRTENVKRAAKLIDQTIIYPNEEFSFVNHVSPVTTDNGYVYGTIFVQAKPVQGIGGGICQVSSTLYNTMLKAGIVASERQNHSLAVDYVPLGLDATMTDNGIDLKFTNPYDAPLYIRSYTKDTALTVELWSVEDLLQGVEYEAKSTISEEGRVAHTTLYGYDEDGEVVLEEYLHKSVYQ